MSTHIQMQIFYYLFLKRKDIFKNQQQCLPMGSECDTGMEVKPLDVLHCVDLTLEPGKYFT